MWLFALYALLPAVGGLMWYWGGCGERCHPGLPPLNKSWRRYVWPVIVGLVLLLTGYTHLTTALITAALIGVNTLGYGHSKPWWYRTLVALALGAPFILIPLLSLWAPLITLAVFIPLYVLSLRHNWMTWGVVESITGSTQGAIVAIVLSVGVAIRMMYGA